MEVTVLDIKDARLFYRVKKSVYYRRAHSNGADKSTLFDHIKHAIVDTLPRGACRAQLEPLVQALPTSIKDGKLAQVFIAFDCLHMALSNSADRYKDQSCKSVRALELCWCFSAELFRLVCLQDAFEEGKAR